MSPVSYRTRAVPRQRAELVELSRSECIRLLADQRFGRLAVNTGTGVPLLRPVNYRFDVKLQAVVFRTHRGSKFHALVNSSEAAFEIDHIDEALRAGWSVVIRGPVEEVVGTADTRRLELLGLETWAPGFKPHWMQIRAWTVSGRRILVPEHVAPETYLG